jgi:hypothetical protein
LVVAVEVGGLALAGPVEAGEDDLGPLGLGGDGEGGEEGEQSEFVVDGVHEVTSGVS